MNNPTREEHLQWCKDRALEYAREGDLLNAFASFGSDLGKHPQTENHAGLKLGTMLMLSGQLRSAEAMERFINGFH